MATINPADDVSVEPEAKKQKLENETDEDVCVEPEVKKQKLDNETVESVCDEAKTENADDTSNVTKLEKSIIDQIEYYFGDSNLFRDKFLTAEIEKNEGWVAITTLTTFKRLAALSTDVKQIIDALEKSDSGLLEINSARDSIRRHPDNPLPERNEETRQEIISRSAYVKGFPKEMEMPEFIEFFKDFPKVIHVTIRKYLDKPTKTYKSKGSAFVTFNTREQCAAFLSQNVKHNDTELITKWQSDYYAGKKTEREELKKEKQAKLDPEIELPKGTILLITEIKPDNTREIIKQTIEKFETEVAFVEFAKGDERAYVRLSSENGGKELLAKLTDGKLKFGENESPVSLLEGEEEEKYLKECVEKMKLRRKANNRNNRQHKFGSRKRD